MHTTTPTGAPPRHGNTGMVNNKTRAKIALARERAEDGTLPADSKHLRSDAWKALPGSTPVDLMARTGCVWPVESDGTKHLFCNLAVEPGRLEYCPDHLKRYHSPREALK